MQQICNKTFYFSLLIDTNASVYWCKANQIEINVVLKKGVVYAFFSNSEVFILNLNRMRHIGFKLNS